MGSWTRYLLFLVFVSLALFGLAITAVADDDCEWYWDDDSSDDNSDD